MVYRQSIQNLHLTSATVNEVTIARLKKTQNSPSTIYMND